MVTTAQRDVSDNRTPPGSTWRRATRPAAAAIGELALLATLGLATRNWPIATQAAILLIATAVCAATAVFAHRRREAGMRRIADAINRVANGDLSASPQTSGDPGLDAVAVSAARLVAVLRETVVVLADGMRRASEGYRALVELSKDMGTTAETAADRATAVAAAADQVAGSVHRVAGATEEFNATIGDVARHAEQAAAVARSAAAQAHDATATMHDLGAASQQVTQIVDLIANIARQTHLLALNATLEAARAGDAGKGFAVVASSVKQLAERTAAATGDVTATVRGIQAGAASASTAIEQITSTIAQVNENQTAIAVAVDQQTATTTDMGRGATEAARGASEIAGYIGGLVDLATATAYAGAQSRTTAADFAHLATSFEQVASRFDIADLLSDTRDDERVQCAVTQGDITRIEDTVRGSGVNQFEFRGEWRFSSGNVEADGTNTYSCRRDDTARVRFVGSKITLFGVTDANHGIIAVKIDNGDEVSIDEYSPSRSAGVALWQSEELPRGEHVLQIRVTGERNPTSRFSWATVDRVEVS